MGSSSHQLRVQSASVWNLYGPTETTIWSSVYQLESQENLISIGRAIPNTQIYISWTKICNQYPLAVPGENVHWWRCVLSARLP